MEFNSSKPIYIQLKEYYEHLIDTGSLKENDEMPSVREIALFFKINPNTAQRALTLLVEDGYLRNVPKKGFYVTSRNVDKTKAIKEILDELNTNGISHEEIYEYLKKELKK